MTTRIAALSLAGLLLVLGGCSAVPMSFDVSTRSRTTIEKGTVVEQLVGSMGFGDLASFDISQSEGFRNSDAQKRFITSAKLARLDLSVVSPQGQTFDFLNELEFFVEAPGQSRMRIAHAMVPDGVSNFSCNLDDVELAPYAKADSMSITTTVNGRRPDRDTQVEAHLVLRVSTALWGAAGE